jgi:mono/diheme cytochrome c family protein
MREKTAVVATLVIGIFFVVASSWLRGNALAGQAAPAAAKTAAARGEYLVNFGSCQDCHTPKVFTPQGPVPDMSKSLSGAPAGTKLPPVPPGSISPTGWGGMTTNDLTAWVGPWGTSFAANLTPDKTTGLGSWTEAAFIKSMRTGKHKGVLRDILPPMPWQGVGKLSDDDLKAVFAYLQTLKPVQNQVPDPLPPKR